MPANRSRFHVGAFETAGHVVFAQAGWIDVHLAALDIAPNTDYTVHDLLSDQRFTWRNGRNFVQLDPQHTPAHIFVVYQRMRAEQDFDTFEG